ncbi:hypothetical protein [Corynebacterium glutamicum]|uniref:Uncharacterized protein n=1 Tax=Corynebacterium glutamicum (strain R) TaxID=340322 RepID=A0AB72VAH3_CORGB|nr:hypothetical protein [Corynebacterium glutamicum]BAF54337.1 hypothetical protein cgR_1355 [Corynebacterium glutamicum R]
MVRIVRELSRYDLSTAFTLCEHRMTLDYFKAFGTDYALGLAAESEAA